ncbi:MAG: glycerol-3-phosphate 1-O-acyltransferase PlsY [Clostridia bacterium]|nr:glycerol-3-phosphate 1-O-acyltransferase PlsY [Clostridia bacterium]
MNNPLMLVLTCVIAYLIGSVSAGIITSRVFHGPDLHTVGSKSSGATNVQRTMGWKYGIITLLGDALKGVLACWIGSLLVPDPIEGVSIGALAAGLFVTIGHNWPVFFGFKGGKGVATGCGVMLFVYPIPALICIGLTIVLIAILRYVSVGSMFLLTSYALLVTFWTSHGNPWIIAWAWALALMCIIRHRANINRLIHHSENKLGKKKE